MKRLQGPSRERHDQPEDEASTPKNAKMESTMLVNLPEEIFRNGLFPYLPVNDLLRFRLASKWTKCYADDYLRVYAPSKKTTLIRLGFKRSLAERVPEIEESEAMGTFLKLDRSIKMRKPTSHFRLFFRCVHAFDQVQMREFLQLYGNQVEHLQVTVMWIPMTPRELEFYEKLPKLKSLTVAMICLNPDFDPSSEEHQCDIVPCPSTFRKLKTLKIEFHFVTYGTTETSHLWKLIQSCSQLEHLRLPVSVVHSITNEHQHRRGDMDMGYFGNVLRHKFPHLWPEYPEAIPVVLKRFKQILQEQGRQHFQSLDIRNLNADWGRDIEHMELALLEVTMKYKLKLANVPGIFLSKITSVHLNQIAQHVVSVTMHRNFPWIQSHDFKGVALPNVEKVTGLVWTCLEWALPFLKARMTTVLFPGLRKLEIFILNGSGISLAYIWETFRNLEEVTIAGCVEETSDELLGDSLFFGRNPNHVEDPQEPAFLQLTNLKKLSLPRLHQLKGLTDVAFTVIFSQMSLREFHLVSAEPITWFTRSGIQALLTGPFVNTIEKFSFGSWMLSGLSYDEFQQLSREFPCNKST